ncbi:MAG TPA: hypothetical protein VIM85_07995 [Pseudomonadales bacterium]
MKKQLSIATLVSLLGLGSSGASALSDKEVESRLDRLENKVSNIDRRASQDLSKTNEQINKYLARLKINGFLSAAVSTLDEDNVLTSAGGLSNSENHASNAIAGLQFDFTINDKTNAVLQLTANGLGHRDSQDSPGTVAAEWAYLAYHLTDNLTFRAGRLRLPFYMASEYLEVGYAYPWVSPPGAVYGLLPFDSYYGADVTYNFNLAGIDIAYQGYRGTVELETNFGTFNIKGIYGNALTFTKGPYSFRTSFSQAKVEGTFNADGIAPDFVLESAEFQTFAATTGPALIAAQVGAECAPCDLGDIALAVAGTSDNDMYLLYLATTAGGGDPVAGGALVASNFSAVEDLQASYFDYALAYNNHGWNIIAEGDRYAAGGSAQDIEGHYLSVAKQLGQWTPYAVFGEVYSTTDSDFGNAVADIAPSVVNGLGFHPVNQRESTLGVRWDFAPGVALKLETQNLTRFKGTRGLFVAPLGDAGSVNVYSLAIDAVF